MPKKFKKKLEENNPAEKPAWKRDRSLIRPVTGDYIMSRRELGGYVGLSERTIIRMEQEGRIPPAKRISKGRVGHWRSTGDRIIAGDVFPLKSS